MKKRRTAMRTRVTRMTRRNKATAMKRTRKGRGACYRWFFAFDFSVLDFIKSGRSFARSLGCEKKQA